MTRKPSTSRRRKAGTLVALAALTALLAGTPPSAAQPGSALPEALERECHEAVVRTNGADILECLERFPDGLRFGRQYLGYQTYAYYFLGNIDAGDHVRALCGKAYQTETGAVIPDTFARALDRARSRAEQSKRVDEDQRIRAAVDAALARGRISLASAGVQGRIADDGTIAVSGYCVDGNCVAEEGMRRLVSVDEVMRRRFGRQLTERDIERFIEGQQLELRRQPIDR